jgi:hypothetical protein
MFPPLQFLSVTRVLRVVSVEIANLVCGFRVHVET